MDVYDFFGQGWAELIAKKLTREDKKSLSQVSNTSRNHVCQCGSEDRHLTLYLSRQVSRAARVLVYRTVSQLVATCDSSIASSRFPQLRDLEIQGKSCDYFLFITEIVHLTSR